MSTIEQSRRGIDARRLRHGMNHIAQPAGAPMVVRTDGASLDGSLPAKMQALVIQPHDALMGS
jgi:hypothetical protein